MKSKWMYWLIPFVFVVVGIVFFYPYFAQKKVPIPFNLLVSFYSPWKYEPGYGVGIQNKPLGDDNLKLFYPFRKFTIDEMKAGKIPLWNPYFLSGSIHHGTYQSALFYPFNFIYFLLPLADAWSVLIVLQPILAGWFMYFFLRSLRLSRGSSLFGSLVFAFSGWMMAYWEEVLVVEHTILWLPLALYGSNILWDSKRIARGFIVLFTSITFAILAGFPQMIVYLVLTTVFWNYFRFCASHQSNRLRLFLLVMGAMLLGLFVTALQWVPALEAYIYAPRAAVDASNLFSRFLTRFTYLITFIAPDFWGNPGTYNYFSTTIFLQERTIFFGIPGLVFALYALMKRSIPTFWKVFTLVSLSLGFAIPTSWIWYTLHVPILSVAMPVRIFILSTFGFSILATYGLDLFLQKKSPKDLKNILIPISAVVVLLWVFACVMFLLSKNHSFLTSLSAEMQKQVLKYGSISMRNLVFSTLMVIGIAVLIFYVTSRRRIFVLSMCLLTLLSSWILARKFLYFSDRQFEYPLVEPIKQLQELSEYNRIWSYGDGYIVRNIPTYFHLFSAEGYEALFSYRYGIFLYSITTRGQLTNRIQRTDATLSETGQYEPMTNNPVRLRIMSLLGVKYILEHKDSAADQVLKPTDRFTPALFNLAWQNERWRIWKFRQALPRAFMAYQTVLATDPQKIVDKVLDPSLDLRSTLVVEDPKAMLEGKAQGAEEAATFVSYQPSEVIVRVNTPEKGLLFLSDTYYPGWHAFVDGKEQPIYRADFVLRAVPVPKGTHVVRFVYDPLSWKLGLAISELGLCAAVLILIGRKRILSS